MKFIFPAYFLPLGLLLSHLAVGELSYNVTATKDGRPLDASAIQLTPYTPAGTSGLGGLGAAFNSSTAFTPTTKVLTPPARSGSGSGKRRGLQSRNEVVVNSGWCGAVYTTPTSDNPITAAHGYFQVPTPSPRPSVTTFPQYVSEWVGIDGASWNTAVLQSGVTSGITEEGEIANYVWWQWYPDSAVAINSMSADSGDWFEVMITASSSSAGTIFIRNASQDQNYTFSISGGPTLGLQNAEWIIEDPSGGNYAQVPFAWFPYIWFEDTYAATANGSTYGISSSELNWVTNMCESSEYDNDDMYGWAVTST